MVALLATMTAVVAAGTEPASAASAVNFVQGAAFSGSAGTTLEGVTLASPVSAGDLLVAWVGAYAQPGPVSVRDPVNGTWTRAPGSLTFSNGSGDIALFYVVSKAASNLPVDFFGTSGGCTQACAMSGAVADYRGTATSGPLDQIVLSSGYGTAVQTSPTSAVPAGELVYSAVISGAFEANAPQPGTSAGVPFTARASQYGSAYEQDIVSSAAGAQQGAANWSAGSPNTDWYAVVATFRSANAPPPPPPAPSYVQGTAFSTGSRVTQLAVPLSQPVTAGDLLVGWFAEYNVAGQVQVSDSVNGSWTRAPGSLSFTNGSGDIALYYKVASQAATSMTITVSAPAAAYLSGTVAEYQHVAASGALDQIAMARGAAPGGNNALLSSGTTAAVPAGELIYGALITGGSPTRDTPGTGFTARAATGSGSAFEEDDTPGPAGQQQATVTIQTPTDWYLVVATFHPGS